MKTIERTQINKEQINRFFHSYYTEWRHIQILTLQKLYQDKYNFYGEIIESTQQTDEQANESTITQEISNGILFEGIQTNLQYIEDLFALINACEKPDYFIRKIIKYNAGTVTNLIKNTKLSRKVICKQFHFPYFDPSTAETQKETDTLEVMNDSIDRLSKIIAETVEFYKHYEFFYNQYKHGLSIALRPYRTYTEQEVDLDKAGKYEQPPLVALDSLNFKDAPKNQYGNTGYLLIPTFSEVIRQNMKVLQQENNLIRFVHTPPGLSMDALVKQAAKTKRCMQMLIHNFLEVINEKNPMMLRLPAKDESQVYEFNIAAENP